MNAKKTLIYAANIENLILEALDKNSDLYIGDISENIAEFITALCVLIPHNFLERYTQEDIENLLDSNHVANSLCVQFMQEVRDQNESKNGEGHEQE